MAARRATTLLRTLRLDAPLWTRTCDAKAYLVEEILEQLDGTTPTVHRVLAKAGDALNLLNG